MTVPDLLHFSSNTPQNSATESARQTPRKGGTAIQQSIPSSARKTAHPPQLSQTSSNPGFVLGGGWCGIRTILFVLTRILKKTFVVSDGRDDYTVGDSIDWRIVNTNDARRIMAAAIKTYASVFVQRRDIIYDES